MVYTPLSPPRKQNWKGKRKKGEGRGGESETVFLNALTSFSFNGFPEPKRGEKGKGGGVGAGVKISTYPFPRPTITIYPLIADTKKGKEEGGSKGNTDNGMIFLSWVPLSTLISRPSIPAAVTERGRGKKGEREEEGGKARRQLLLAQFPLPAPEDVFFPIVVALARVKKGKRGKGGRRGKMECERRKKDLLLL